MFGTDRGLTPHSGLLTSPEKLCDVIYRNQGFNQRGARRLDFRLLPVRPPGPSQHHTYRGTSTTCVVPITTTADGLTARAGLLLAYLPVQTAEEAGLCACLRSAVCPVGRCRARGRRYPRNWDRLENFEGDTR